MQIDKLTSRKSIIIFSLLLAIFIIYPNIVYLRWDLEDIEFYGGKIPFFILFVFRYVFFATIIFISFLVNVRHLSKDTLARRLGRIFVIVLVSYGIYILIAFAIVTHGDSFNDILIFQFAIVFLLCVLLGQILAMYSEQRKKEQEIEQLKVESLQSRCEALANQINPHFFFNSLGGLSSLVREDDKERTLEYVNKLSAVFRYILQSDKKGLVTLDEEFDFLESYRYLLEVRYANKLSFDISTDSKNRKLKLPVLSLLPLIENVVKHNVIDSENRMVVSVLVNEKSEVVVSNPTHKKLEESLSNGIGLTNLKNRFMLLMDSHIQIEKTDDTFRVYLPLKE
jgi:sensor histidine kinase YesM